MKSNQRIALVVWLIFSVGACFLISVVGAFLTAFGLSEINKSSSAPGDYSATPPDVILGSIYRHCGWLLAVNALVLTFVWCVTRELMRPSKWRDVSRGLRAFCMVLLLINAALLIGMPVVVGLDYWRERAPYFPKNQS